MKRRAFLSAARAERLRMCIAEIIAFDIMKLLGHREPQRHPDWERVVDQAQSHIDDNLERMKRVAESEVDMETRRLQRKSKLGKIIACLKGT